MSRSEALRILGLSENASFEQARTVYLRAVRELHPDQYHDKPHLRSSAENTLKAINTAWDCLKRDYGFADSSQESQKSNTQTDWKNESKSDHSRGSGSRPKAEAFDLEAAWRVIDAVVPPGPDPRPSPVHPVVPCQESVQLGHAAQHQAKLMYGWWVAFSAIAICINVIVGFWVALGAYIIIRRKFRNLNVGSFEKYKVAAISARHAYESVLKPLHEKGGEQLYAAAKSQLASNRDEYCLLPQTLEERLKQFLEEEQKRQLREHLVAHEIAPGIVIGIGTARIESLRREFIDNAADVLNANQEMLTSVAGIGVELAFRLRSWALEIQNNFKFSNTRIDQDARTSILASHQAKKSELEQALAGGPEKLTTIKNSILRVRADLAPKLTPAFQQFLQDEANWKAASSPSSKYHQIAVAILVVFYVCVAAVQVPK